MLSPSRAPLPGKKKQRGGGGEARREWRWGQRQHAYYHPVIYLRTNPLNAAMLLLHFVAFWGQCVRALAWICLLYSVCVVG